LWSYVSSIRGFPDQAAIALPSVPGGLQAALVAVTPSCASDDRDARTHRNTVAEWATSSVTGDTAERLRFH
jgi:hypothetical protein